jgi:uncharacterized membrane protein YgdD (TMEM256/DUF423 family)
MTFAPPPRLFVAFGALCAASGVALSAYAAHAVQGVAAAQLSTAALFALLHGIALTALAPVASDRIGRFALGMLALGTLLFSGSLVAHWLLYAVGALRR